MFNLFLLRKSAFAAFLFTIPLLFSPDIQAQTITGTVLDAQSKDPLIGAAVRQQGTTRGVVTQDDGSFELQLSENGEEELLITFLGYKDLEVDVSDEKQDLELFLYPETYIGDDVFVSAVRVDETSPITFTNVDREEIERRNLGQDVPYLLQNTPSVTTTSDAGAGVGYTGIRIRGVDPARINVTINGIPVNDAESHGVFWVDLPDLASSIENIQVQRGVGTSTNGAGAFGATINLQTSSSSPEPFGEINTGIGSFNTRKYNVRLGSGLMENGWQFEGRLSKIDSDGFIDRASSDLDSYFLSASHHGERSLLRADVFTGKEITYQAWYGIEESVLENNRTFNEAGTEKSGQPYEDQVDDYQQNYYQLHYSYQLQENWNANISAFYTKGFGYYEEYKAEESLADYSISTIEPGTPTESDLVRRRWLDNDYYGTIFATRYAPSDTWNVTFGGGYSYYDGAHFGEVIWARYAGDSENNDRYYDNDGIKKDFNLYGKLQYQLTEKLNSYLDLQVRTINYEFLGNDIVQTGTPPNVQDNLVSLRQEDNLSFFNPKFGLVYNLNDGQRAYASFGVGGKEPTRDEYVNSTPDSRPSAEKLYNVEAGYRGDFTSYFLGANLYGMFYEDQLVPTGAINDVGEIVRQNVPESYRVGVELQGGVSLGQYLSLSANATFSQNKIVEYTQFTDQYDASFNFLGQQETVYEDTDIAFSPSVITNGVIGYKKGGLNAELVSKYVSRQYLDNTETESRSIDPYFVNDVRLSYAFNQVPLFEGITATLQVNNIFNHEYETNGYTFGWLQDGDPVNFNYYYPQAGTNFLFQVKWEF
ncbi:MAG: TonB-dependent receptor [Balneola sp.]|nr:TonB-dependent receptor [Balneola sp.]MBE77970.1 TonB-dependent receptor [Balneola sp.]|tara:strand:- start:8876 stop:11329 length:2454 start_codon:yes stop_codon:yes gene_type:complete